MTYDLLHNLIKLVSYNVLGDRQLRSRFIGFRAEYVANNWLRTHGSTLYTGGMFVPVLEGNRALKEAVYFTCISEDEDLSQYINVYNQITALNLIGLFLFVYNPSIDNWKRSVDDFEVLIPEIKVYQFKDGNFILSEHGVTAMLCLFTLREERYREVYISPTIKNYIMEIISEVSQQGLKQLYVERFIFDFILARNHKKGIPTDIDLIVKRSNTTLKFLEVKEKDLSRNNGFGLDLHRLRDMLEISKSTNVSYVLLVRQVDNQSDRNFVAWKSINIRNFANRVKGNKPILGGTGMRSVDSTNPTLICPVRYFASPV